MTYLGEMQDLPGSLTRILGDIAVVDGPRSDAPQELKSAEPPWMGGFPVTAFLEGRRPGGDP